jgi:hypothetical protein
MIDLFAACLQLLQEGYAEAERLQRLTFFGDSDGDGAAGAGSIGRNI